jgi:hypothetical protein
MEGFWTRQRKMGSAFPDAQSSRRNPMQGINGISCGQLFLPSSHENHACPILNPPLNPKRALAQLGLGKARHWPSHSTAM